ncbi:MAG: peptidoglycan DD-metalloendopeptidase family protein [Anaerolineae bacterium]|nr:peptidoglycan DD-metalloendopeptidase family protein [Anaerolineae bacterium]
MRPNQFLTLLLLFTVALILPSAGDPPPTPAPPEIQAELSAAFSRRLLDAPVANMLTFQLFSPEVNTAFTSPDGKTAVLWLALRDDAGRVLATEPGLALARLSDDGWQVILPGDPEWDIIKNGLPEGMLPVEQSPAPTDIALESLPSRQALTGYYLPYVAGTARWLEGSISHFQSIPELGYPSCSAEFCRYAYDFTDVDMYPLVASKSGTVVGTRDSCTNGSPTCTNYIVLYNAADDAYQIYIHLANGTIPDNLTPDTPVVRGQYLGDTDDTGYSTSQHVHFMVTNSIYFADSGYYWGRSIDIRFADVSINNGIPRTCYEVTRFAIYDGATECLGNKADPRNPANDWFVSGNVGAYPPTGALTRPAAGITVAAGNNPLMDVTANASDDVRVSAVRLMAKINSQWVEIGPKVTQPAAPGVFDWDVNLCEVGPLNGALEVAVRIWDHEGNVTPPLSPRTIQVDHACPAPSSQLNPAETFDSTAVRLSWTAASAGPSLSTFELQWRTEPGTWNPSNTQVIPANQSSTWFAGDPGGQYAFRLRVMDANGQWEAWPANDTAEIMVALPAACIPDTAEPDDISAQAGTLAPGEWAQRNLCGPGDPDWFKVTLPESGDYQVNVPSLSGGAAVKISVYTENGQTLLANGQAAGVGQNARIILQTAAPGTVLIKIEPLLPNLSGTQAQYRIQTTRARLVFLPFIMR